jgi:DNA-binding LacI/PurR family transcriptional regulator
MVVSNTVVGGYHAGEALLGAESPLPDGIFATTDAIALGLLEAFRAHGIQVPEDVALVGHDGLFASTVSMPALTTIKPPMTEMGRTSIELLLQLMDGGAPPPLTVLDAEFVVRESTIGSGARARRGFATPLSGSEAWACWRSQLAAASDKQLSSRTPPVPSASRT